MQFEWQLVIGGYVEIKVSGAVKLFWFKFLEPRLAGPGI